MYLRDLPKALVDDSIVVRLYNAVDLCKQTHHLKVYFNLISASDNFNISINMMKATLESLHPAHLSTLRFLINHLSR